MRLDLYQAETARIAAEQVALLAQARDICLQGRALTALEQSGVPLAASAAWRGVAIRNALPKARRKTGLPRPCGLAVTGML